jgi:hypothetical protein
MDIRHVRVPCHLRGTVRLQRPVSKCGCTVCFFCCCPEHCSCHGVSGQTQAFCVLKSVCLPSYVGWVISCVVCCCHIVDCSWALSLLSFFRRWDCSHLRSLCCCYFLGLLWQATDVLQPSWLIVPPDLDVPSLATRCLRACRRVPHSSSGSWNFMGGEMKPNFA